MTKIFSQIRGAALLIVTLLAASVGAQAQTVFYVRGGATGANTGLDWNNAYSALPASMKRGATYYIAAGSYNPHTFSDAESGTSVITLTSATAANHGTDTGWSASFVGQALFLGESVFNTGYYTVDGQTRGTDWRSGYLIKFWNQNNNVNGAAVHMYSANHLTFRYVELQGTTDKPIAGDTTGDLGFQNHAQQTDLYVGYSYVHETGNTQFQLNYGNSDRFICEYNYIYKNHTAWNANHDEAFSLTFANSTIRYNIMQDIMSSGFICDAAGGSPTISNWEVYGNVFFWDTAYQNDSRVFLGDGMVGFFGEVYSGHFYFYNNTIVGIKSAANNNANGGMYGVPASGMSPVVVQNNIWSDCTTVGDVGPGADYNSYYGGASNDNDKGSHSVTSAVNPFVNVGGFDFHLTVATAVGVSVAAPYNADLNGNLRGSDGFWDRGAYEFGAVNNNPPVISGQAATTIAPQSATIVWTTDKPATSGVQYGPTTAYGSAATNSALVTSHSLAIAGLNPGVTYHYLVKSADSGNRITSSTDLTFATPAPDSTPPTVSLTGPTAGASLVGAATLTATANDNVGVGGVTFLVDGQVVGAEVTVAPYSYSWNSGSVTNGTHSIKARARDTSGNTTLSSAVSVSVQNVVATGLVGYWSFDNASGTTAPDVSGQGNAATLSGGAGWVAGAVGSTALTLDGVTGLATVPDAAALQLSGDLTISLWANHITLPALNSWMYYVEKGQGGLENYAVGAYTDAGGTRLFFEFVDSTSAYRYYPQSTGATLSPGVWSQIAVVYDHTHGQLSFYNNGQQIATTPTAQALQATATPLLLGQQNIPGFAFPLAGAVDEVRIYNRALAPTEVTQLAGVTRPPAPTGFRLLP